MTINKLTAQLETTLAAYGDLAATGELVTMWNRLKAQGKTDTKVGQWVDSQLAKVEGWAMDAAGYLYMV